MNLTKKLVPQIVLFVAAVAPAVLLAAEARIELRRDGAKGRMQVLIDGNEAFVYQYDAQLDLPHFYPVRSPYGKSMTIQHPNPYPHHRSIWFADKVQLDGERAVSFYSALYSGESRQDPQPPFQDHIRHLEFVDGPVSPDWATLTEKLVWEMDHTKRVLDERRDVRIVALGDGEYLLDIAFTVTASSGDVTFVSDAVHYAWPYIRMNSTFSVAGGGTITNSAGGINQQGTHNQVARWVDYSNAVDGQTAGLAVFSHSDNPQPHRWLTRDYGTFGPRRADAQSGKPFTLSKGESLSFRVGILVHRGDVKSGAVAERFERYNAGKL